MLSFAKDMTELNRNRNMLFNAIIFVLCIWASSILGNNNIESSNKTISTSQVVASSGFSSDILLPGNNVFPELHKIFVENASNSQFLSAQIFNQFVYEELQNTRLKQVLASYLIIKPEHVFRSLCINYYTSDSGDYPEIS